MSRIEDFLPDVMLSADECPEEVALRAIRSALREFCIGSRVWQMWLDPEIVAAGETEIAPDLPAGTQRVAVIEARRDGKQIRVVSEADLNNGRLGSRRDDFVFDLSAYRAGDWRDIEGPDVLALVTTSANDTLGVFPKLEAGRTNEIEVRVALAPTMLATEVADELLDEWGEYIAQGALRRLLVMPGKPWFMPAAAAGADRQFRRGKARAKAKALRGFTGRSLTMRPGKIVGMA